MNTIAPFVFVVLLVFAPGQARSGGDSAAQPQLAQRVAEQRRRADLIDALQQRTFRFFIEHCNPDNGLVKDRSTESSPASIAATGFAVPIWAIGAERGWITRERALALTTSLLQFLHDSEQSDAADATGYRGLYYHFLDMQTGRRVWRSELSTIDTALLLAGVRFARTYYDGGTAAETAVRELADALTRRVQWDWLTVGDDGRFDGSLSHGWRPEKGAIRYGWIGYNEALVLYVLAAGSGYRDAETAYRRWTSAYDWREPWPGEPHVTFGPLFGHQYSHVFVDFRGVADDFLREKGIDYFENSRRAVHAQRRYAIGNPGDFIGYGPDVWGLTACDGPGPGRDTENRSFHGYAARGAVGPALGPNDDGTIAPTAAAASIVFAPRLAVDAIVAMHDRYGAAGLWGELGFKDAFNPTADWFATDYLGIDQGPIVLMLENWRNGFVWRHMMRDPVVRGGLARLGFDEPPPRRFEDAIRAFERQDRERPPAAGPVLFVGSSSIVRWRDLATDMAPMPTLNRGFGGSEASDVIHFFDRVVTPYAPRAIVLYEGDNDIAAGCRAIEVLVRVREIARLVAQHLPGTPLLVLAIKPSLQREQLWPEMQLANELLRDFCACDEGCEFVDIRPALLTEDGRMRDDVFVEDRLHLNRTGYRGWARIVRSAVERRLR